MPGLAPNGADYGASFLTSSSGNLPIFAAIRRAPSGDLAEDRVAAFLVDKPTIYGRKIAP
jgi:hypothetical protein